MKLSAYVVGFLKGFKKLISAVNLFCFRQIYNCHSEINWVLFLQSRPYILEVPLVNALHQLESIQSRFGMKNMTPLLDNNPQVESIRSEYVWAQRAAMVLRLRCLRIPSNVQPDLLFFGKSPRTNGNSLKL